MPQPNETYNCEIFPDTSRLPAGAALREVSERGGRACRASGSIPIGFAAERLTAWVRLDGVSAGDPEGAGEAVLQARVSRNNSRWSDWLHLAWYGGPEHEKDAQPALPAVWRGATEAHGVSVKIDEVQAGASAPFRFAQFRVLTRGDASLVGLGFAAMRAGQNGWTEALDLEPLADSPVQHGIVHIAQFDVPDIGWQICSPVSVLMAAGALGGEVAGLTAEDASRIVLDHQADMYGNWARAVQLGHELGVRVRLEYGDGLARAIEHLRAGRILIPTVRYPEGGLTGAPQAKSSGHLILIAGYDAAARRLLAYDSAAAKDAAMPIAYDVHEFCRVWLERSALCYVVDRRR